MFKNIKSRLEEVFADTWTLLSDTDRFVSRAGLMPTYERKLKEWRSRIQKNRNNSDETREIKNEIIVFRRAMRQAGWEIRLGSLDIAVKGFRSDDSINQGFRRIVLKLGEQGEVFYTVGSANHIQLDEELNAHLQTTGTSVPLESHYLWYRRYEGVLELAGADSQGKDQHENLKTYVEAHKSDMVRVLYKLR